ncbi:GroES-like protein [Trichoderma chlorosporum]
MREAFAYSGPKVDVVESAIPTAGAFQMIVKVACVGLNPKGWKVAEGAVPGVTYSNEGDDFAGVIHEVGQGVTEFRVGDRVGVFHKVLSPGGGWAEYAIAWESMTFHLADHVSFEEAATIPLAVITSCLGLYRRLPLPYPWDPCTKRQPIIIYGAASAVGANAIKLAVLSNIHPIVAVAGRGINFVESLIDRSRGDTIIDYRQGDDAVIKGIKTALRNQETEYAFDAVSEKGTVLNISQVINSTTGKIVVVLDTPPPDIIPKGISRLNTAVETSQADLGNDALVWPNSQSQRVGITHFTTVMLRFIGRGLNEGWFSAHPYEIVRGGLHGLEAALRRLKNGSVSATKLVVKISDTEGLRN